MTSFAITRLTQEAPTKSTPPQGISPDYCSRAIALWPRLERSRLARAGNDPGRLAALVARRTRLPHSAILELLGVPASQDSGPAGDR
jgi:hypothetical protein